MPRRSTGRYRRGEGWSKRPTTWALRCTPTVLGSLRVSLRKRIFLVGLQFFPSRQSALKNRKNRISAPPRDLLTNQICKSIYKPWRLHCAHQNGARSPGWTNTTSLMGPKSIKSGTTTQASGSAWWLILAFRFEFPGHIHFIRSLQVLKARQRIERSLPAPVLALARYRRKGTAWAEWFESCTTSST